MLEVRPAGQRAKGAETGSGIGYATTRFAADGATSTCLTKNGLSSLHCKLCAVFH